MIICKPSSHIQLYSVGTSLKQSPIAGMLGQELPALEDENSKHGQHFAYQGTGDVV